MSSTFEANPNGENEPWIEKAAFEGLKFRIWHIMFFCLGAFGILVVFFCCCIRIRVPRTKQEIEADYKRTKITGKFRKRLKFISNQDMEAINLQKALEIIIQADYKNNQSVEALMDPKSPETDTTVSPGTSKFRNKIISKLVISKGATSNTKY
ncbi:uncharacterized protein LOC143206815 isoform X1 [Rhynchophorus ferrugineus]|uniref:Transmembrane inner ear expressed protein n=1 Tax=Rhynchophorus ferrugineus TaxID=354439 RepID=A0A834HSA2_RHYFE|nr:hypothetical protein GWI33_020114 [Rhynchophorus ferrugineus]